MPRGRRHHAWVVFGVAFFTLLAFAGFRSTPGHRPGRLGEPRAVRPDRSVRGGAHEPLRPASGRGDRAPQLIFLPVSSRLVGVFDVAGTIGSGWLTDHVDTRRLLFVYDARRGVSLMVLDPALDARNADSWTSMIFYGLDWVATVPSTVALCSRQFGRDRGPVVYGWVFAGHQIGDAQPRHDQVVLAPA